MIFLLLVMISLLLLGVMMFDIRMNLLVSCLVIGFFSIKYFWLILMVSWMYLFGMLRNVLLKELVSIIGYFISLVIFFRSLVFLISFRFSVSVWFLVLFRMIFLCWFVFRIILCFFRLVV